MSEDGFHVHGPHDHALEHVAEHGMGHDSSMANQLAVVTAILATAGALFSYMAGATQAEASLDKNNAAISKTEAADQWNFYQAKSGKEALANLASALVPDAKRDFYVKEAARYKAEKQTILDKAEQLEKVSKNWDQASDREMESHHRWAQATTILQVSIALAAIALLTRKRWLEWGTIALGLSGTVAGLLAWFKG